MSRDRFRSRVQSLGVECCHIRWVAGGEQEVVGGLCQPVFSIVYPTLQELLSAVTTSKKIPRIQALARASAIVDVIADAGEGGVGLSDISRATDLNKTTAFNLLASLVTLRFVEQDEHSKHYLLGMRNLELGRLVRQRLHIPSLARPILSQLCRKTHETVNLGLPDPLDLWVVDSFQGSKILHATSLAGWRSFYHCTALGKAFLSQWDNAARRSVYTSSGLPRQTPNTITDIDTLEEQLLAFREQRYALDLEEDEIGVNGIGTTIVDGLGKVAAAISVAGPANRLSKDVLERMAGDVIAAADAITEAIGGGSR